MRYTILLLAFSAAILGGCSTAYKTGQTPDDVYYSPQRPQDEYVQAKNNEDRYYQGDEEYYGDRYLRMKVRNRYLWSDLDDWYFYNNRYNFSYYRSWNYWNNPWSPYISWNYYFNPYGCSYGLMYSKVIATYNHPRVFNLNTYNNQLTNNNFKTPGVNNSNKNSFSIFGNKNNANNSNSNTGNFLRNVFNGSNNGSSSGSRPSSGSSGNSGAKSSAPVRKF
jgi:hypothetical protein